MGRRIEPPSASVMDRSRRERWSAPGKARVIHQVRGTIVVPCRSPLCALLNAAEVWGCHWIDLRDAKVQAAEPGDVPVKMPVIRKRRDRTC